MKKDSASMGEADSDAPGAFPPHHRGNYMSRPFADVIRELSGGQIYEDLTTKLGEIVTGVLETRKQGEISLKLTVKPNGDGSVRVISDVKQKVPEPPRGDTLFFATSSGSLIRNDPRQSELALREVKDEVRPLKEAVNHG
jgi:hypothetical protein